MKFHGLVLIMVWSMATMHGSECSDAEMEINEASRISKRNVRRDSSHGGSGQRGSQGHGSSMIENQNCATYMSIMSHPRDCSEIRSSCSGQALVNGIYSIHPDEYPEPFLVYCKFEHSSGWTVFQRRVDGSVDFHRGWNEYTNGFGFMHSEFWLGNEKLSFLTAQTTYELRIDLTNQNGEPFYATYSSFRVGHENTHFKLVLGEFSGNTTFDSLNHHRNSAFTTHDEDNDNWPVGNCAEQSQHDGGWWFNECDHSNLNGVYGSNTDVNPGAIEWTNLPGGSYGLKSTEMKLRPVLV